MEAATLRLVFALLFRCVGMGKAEVMPVETMISVTRLPDVACGNGLADGTCALGSWGSSLVAEAGSQHPSG